MNYMGRLWEEMQEVAADGKACVSLLRANAPRGTQKVADEQKNDRES